MKRLANAQQFEHQSVGWAQGTVC